jgi:imidazolonepropionase-like amidohydrolase
MKKLVVCLLPALCLALSLFVTQAQEKTPEPKRLAIKAGRLFDPKTGTVTNNAFILLENDRVTAVGPNVSVPAGTEVRPAGVD